MNCLHCTNPTVGKSKYCREHRQIAHAMWREMIQEKTRERENRHETFTHLITKAHSAGMEAGNGITPKPMTVVEQFPNAGKTYFVSEGLCGFASVITKGNTAFGKWCLKHVPGAKVRHYGGGVCIKWVSEFNQSYERKSAYAQAFVEVLRDAGIEAHAVCNLD